MPGRNIVKTYAPESYYHIYSRGVNKQPVFKDEGDYAVFLSILKRYLSKKMVVNSARIPYRQFTDFELLAFCLMPNHVHLLVYQTNERDISLFMKSVMTSYSMYFNKRYKRVGPVFQSNYRASRIESDVYLHHISRYIHLNPKNWQEYRFSSLPYYSGDKHADWVKPGRILDLFDSNREKYFVFLSDYEGQKELLDSIKWQLANPIS